MVGIAVLFFKFICRAVVNAVEEWSPVTGQRSTLKSILIRVWYVTGQKEDGTARGHVPGQTSATEKLRFEE